MSDTLVCYLVAPGEKYKQKALEFMRSYSAYPAGLAHNLLIVIKDGALEPEGQWSYRCESIDWVKHPNAGHDIRSLQHVAIDRSDYDYLMWFGSTARILANDWLAKFREALSGRVGAVAATGSFETGVSGRRYNPHLRTSALMISPHLLNRLGFSLTDTHVDAYEFEHGNQGLYRRLAGVGFSCRVVGANGTVYAESQWPESGTYRHGDQRNLLIADGQTDAYAAATPGERLELAQMAGWRP